MSFPCSWPSWSSLCLGRMVTRMAPAEGGCTWASEQVPAVGTRCSICWAYDSLFQRCRCRDLSLGGEYSNPEARPGPLLDPDLPEPRSVAKGTLHTQVHPTWGPPNLASSALRVPLVSSACGRGMNTTDERLSGLETDTVPPDPLKGQRCSKSSSWPGQDLSSYPSGKCSHLQTPRCCRYRNPSSSLIFHGVGSVTYMSHHVGDLWSGCKAE